MANNNQDVLDEFDKEFTWASFTWNGDNKTGEKIAKQTKRKVKAFISQKLTERTKQVAEIVKGWHIKKGGYTELANHITSRFLDQEVGEKE